MVSCFGNVFVYSSACFANSRSFYPLIILQVSVSLVSNNRPLIQIVRVIAPIYK